ncbi:MAG: hypothetical protein KDE27_25155 [Planctomycetes bacterium]|nr:hypothetical protein [Planctomycetota bacterium]
MHHFPVVSSTAAVLAAALLATAVEAQTWTLATPAANPGPLREAAAAFHGASGNTVLFGNWPSGATTWLYDGSNWSAPTTVTTPPARRSAAMAYDLARGVVVMFGGQGGAVLNDTWEWNGVDWSQVATTTTPPARVGHTLAYDVVRQRTVLFGGTSNPNLPASFADTWEYDGSTWTQVTTANAPSESVESAMCFDLQRQVCVLYGGTSFFGAPDQKTWEYDGVNWSDVTATVGLGPTATTGLGLEQAALVYDQQNGVCLLHGGRTPNGTFPPETWSYDGTGWTMISAGTPSSRTGFAMAMDTARNVVVLYGGAPGNLQTNYTETWEFQNGIAASFTAFGSGCAGSNGVPVLQPQSGSLPRSGTTFTLEIAGLPAAGGFVFLALGFDNTAYGPFTLPLDLGAFGAPGCTAYVRVDTSILLGHAAGSATQAIPIPTGLDGLTFYGQAISIDPLAGNALGAAASNAGTAVIGQ